MAGQKITEKQLAASVKSSASFLMTQAEPGADGKDVESLRRVQLNALVAALRSNGINKDYVSKQALEDTLNGYVVGVEPSENGIKVSYGDGSEVEIPIESGGTGFNEIYWDKETGYFHIRQDGVDVVDPVFIGGGGGSGGGSKITFSCYTPPSFSVIESTGTAPIQFKFESVDNDTGVATGSGNLSIAVGGIVRTNMVVNQGDNQTVDVFRYLSRGNNSVTLTITDSYGAPATRKFTISLEAFDVAWSLADAQMNSEANLSFYITPTGNGAKHIYTYLDGELYANDTVTTSGRRLTKTIENLAHGAHTIEVYGRMDVDGTELESNHLTATVAQTLAGNDTPVVAVNWPAGPLTQYTTTNIPYIVVDPTSNPARVEMLETAWS